jgi:hypothetical protein
VDAAADGRDVVCVVIIVVVVVVVSDSVVNARKSEE